MTVKGGAGTDRVQQQVAELRRTRSVEDCNAAIEKITQMKAGIAAMDARCKSRLDSSQAVIDACGEAIAAWFKGLSAPALECAMKEVRSCCKFGVGPSTVSSNFVPFWILI